MQNSILQMFAGPISGKKNYMKPSWIFKKGNAALEKQASRLNSRKYQPDDSFYYKIAISPPNDSLPLFFSPAHAGWGKMPR
jgi:hypothetical protein